jgi:[pyruvate, water dikinase]-phosphate phosphotransferase / [pyruvate, water dikinase] kinase
VIPNSRHTVHLHLVSDATGDTVRAAARACLVQFEGVEAIEHFWVLVRSAGQMERVLEGIEEDPGLVVCTVVDAKLRRILEDTCHRLQVPFIALLDPVMTGLATYLGLPVKALPGRQHAMDAAYFDRIEATHFAMAHDDGQSSDSLHEADVILVGVSRTSKTPTCIYLANRGRKAANVPWVPEVALPRRLPELKGPLIVGLTIDPNRLIEIRRNRLLMLRGNGESSYVDSDRVKVEVVEARRYFLAKNWPVIDVTRRSIEETAAAIMQLYSTRRSPSSA